MLGGVHGRRAQSCPSHAVTARCVPVHVGRATSVLQVTMTRGDGKVVGVTSQTHLYLGWKD